MPLADYVLSILMTSKDQASNNIRRLAAELTTVQGAGNKARAGLDVAKMGVGEFIKGVGAGIGALTAFGVAAKKAFDLAEQGAQVQQTRESFDSLMKSVGAAPDLLVRLQEASRGTISEMDLMSSTATLLAGVEGELATQLANQAPQIMEIAKAANKLNPALGSVSFQYESLMTGLKRGQKLIIDNTGLTVDIAQANEDYAESLGKTVDQLTDNDRKIALLNATMAAGGVLIDQVGGDVDSTTDAFQRLDAQMSNIVDNAKTNLVPVMTQVAEALTSVVGVSIEEKRALADAQTYAREHSKTADDYNAILRRELSLLSDRLEINKEGDLLLRGRFLRTKDLLQVNYAMTDAEWDHYYAEQRVKEIMAGTNLGAENYAQTLMGLADTTEFLTAKEEAAADQMEEMALEQERLRGQMQTLALFIRGPVGGELEDFSETEKDLAQQAADTRGAIREEQEALEALGGPQGYGGLRGDLEGLQGQLAGLEERMDALRYAEERPKDFTQQMRALQAEANGVKDAIEQTSGVMGGISAHNASWEEHRQKLQELQFQYGEIQLAVIEAKEAHRQAMNEIVFDLTIARLEADGLTDAEYQLAANLAEQMGMIDEATRDTMLNINDALAEFDQSGDLQRAEERILGISSALSGVDAAAAQATVTGWSDSMQYGIEGGLDEGDLMMSNRFEQAREDLEEVGEQAAEIVEKPYDIEMDIADRHGLTHAMAYLVGSTSFLEQGEHVINFVIQTRGEMPAAPAGPQGAIQGQYGAQTVPPMYQEGGIVRETGLAIVHAGELVIPAAAVSQTSGGDGAGSITYGGDTIHYHLAVTSLQEVTSVVQQFDIMRALAGGD